MKTKIFLLALITFGITSCQAQSGTTVYAKNSDISDNLDLRAVASIFGESANLQDFERRLNDPKYQISNLDLNNDDQVDYLRVIESVENRTHVVIIQAVLDRDVYQDIATIDVERDNYNKVSVQVVGNTYLYGANYIYEPVYNVAPVIYTSFWVTNYRPYYSSWTWNYYPTYYYAWRPYPIYRYRSNINVCINVNNHYNYVNYRRSYVAPVLCEPRRTYGYERMRPNNGFSQRHANVSNRYDLDQRRVATRDIYRNQNTNNNDRYSTNRNSNTDNRVSSRNYNENRPTVGRNSNTNRVNSRENSQPNTPVRVENSSRNDSGRDYNQNNGSNGNNGNNSRQYSENRINTNRTVATPRTEPSRNYSENRESRPAQTERSQPARNYSENRTSRPAQAERPQASQRSESSRGGQESRGGNSRENNSNSNSNGRRI